MKHPLEILFAEDVQGIFDHFTACFGIRIAFFSTEGRELQVGLQKSICRYCSLIRSRLYGSRRCLELDQSRRCEAAEQKKMVAYHCHGGLMEAIEPVLLEGRLVGFIMIGQFRTAPVLEKQVSEDWGDANGDVFELEQAFSGVPLIPAAKVQHVLGLFSFLVKTIASQRMVQVRGDLMLEQALDYIHRHVDVPISLGEVAAHLGRSPSTVSHLFQDKLGRSFKREVIERKLRRAEELFRSIPGVTVREVAFKLGYTDPFYFSRLFKKYRGVPPRMVIMEDRDDAH